MRRPDNINEEIINRFSALENLYKESIASNETLIKQQKEKAEWDKEQAYKAERDKVNARKGEKPMSESTFKKILEGGFSKLKNTLGTMIGKIKSTVAEPWSLMKTLGKIVAGAYLIKQLWPLFKKRLDVFWNKNIQPYIDKGFWKTLTEDIKPWFWETLVPFMEKNWKTLLASAGIVAFLKSPTGFLKGIFKSAFKITGVIGKTFIGLGKTLFNPRGLLANSFMAMGTALFSTTGFIAKKAMAMALATATGVSNIFRGGVPTTPNSPTTPTPRGRVSRTLGVAGRGLKGAIKFLTPIARLIPGIGLAVMAIELVDSFFPNLFKDIKEFVMGKDVQEIITPIIQKIKEIGSDLWKKIKEYTPIVLEKGMKLIKNLGSSIIDYLSKSGSDLGKYIYEKVTNKFDEVMDGIENWIRSKSTFLGNQIYGEKQSKETKEWIKKNKETKEKLEKETKEKEAYNQTTQGKKDIVQNAIDGLNKAKEDIIQKTKDGQMTPELSANSIKTIDNAIAFQLSKLGSFQVGGHTGVGKDDEIAGVVHKNEYVVSGEELKLLKYKQGKLKKVQESIKKATGEDLSDLKAKETKIINEIVGIKTGKYGVSENSVVSSPKTVNTNVNTNVVSSPKTVNTNVGDSYYSKLAKVESNNRYFKKDGSPLINRHGFAGKYQMGRETAEPFLKKQGVTWEDFLKSPDIQEKTIRMFTATNDKILKKNGFETSDINRWYMHNMGYGGGIQVIKGKLSPSVLRNMRNQAGMNSNSTVQDYKNYYMKKFGKGSSKDTPYTPTNTNSTNTSTNGIASGYNWGNLGTELTGVANAVLGNIQGMAKSLGLDKVGIPMASSSISDGNQKSNNVVGASKTPSINNSSNIVKKTNNVVPKTPFVNKKTSASGKSLVDNARADIGNGMTYSQSNRGLDKENPESMDCSSWVARMVKKTFGISSKIFGQSTIPQFKYLAQNGTPIPLGQELPGDFATYGNKQSKNRHIAIVSGKGKQIHMSSSGNGVIESNISPTLYGGAKIFRLTNVTQKAPSKSVSSAIEGQKKSAVTSTSGYDWGNLGKEVSGVADKMLGDAQNMAKSLGLDKVGIPMASSKSSKSSLSSFFDGVKKMDISESLKKMVNITSDKPKVTPKDEKKEETTIINNTPRQTQEITLDSAKMDEGMMAILGLV